MKLIEILPNVYGVKVPSDAKIFYEKENQENFLGDLKIGLSEELSLNWRILGFLTKDEISFDASEVVKICKYNNEDYYPNFKEEDFSCDNLEQSFRSALPEEIYFENPFEEPQKISDVNWTEDEMSDWGHDYNTWQTAQENITQKLLILQRVT